MSNRHLSLLSRGLNGRYGPPQAPPKEGMSPHPCQPFYILPLSVFRGTTSLGSADSTVVALPASPTTRDDTGVWKVLRPLS